MQQQRLHHVKNVTMGDIKHITTSRLQTNVSVKGRKLS